TRDRQASNPEPPRRAHAEGRARARHRRGAAAVPRRALHVCGSRDLQGRDGEDLLALLALRRPRLRAGRERRVRDAQRRRPLGDYLAGAKDYIDLVVDQSEEGMVVVEGVQEYSARANWKMLAENSTDVLHVQTLHPTYLDLIRTNSGGAIVRGKLNGGGESL